MPTAYTPQFGGVPNLPTASALSTGAQNIINNAIPGFNGLTKSATGIIGSALSGEVPGDVQRQIQDNAAVSAVNGGMPGSNAIPGSLFHNLQLKDLGLTSLDQNQTGIKDLLSLLGTYSGTVAPTVGQQQEQGNARAQYAAAPQPYAANQEAQSIYDRYMNPNGGFRNNTNTGFGYSPGRSPASNQLLSSVFSQ